MNDERMERPNLNELACDAIRAKIVSGELQPGEKLVETELAERFGLSRTPVKWALIELSNEGLVEVAPRRGAVVRIHSLPEIMEVLRTREVLEGLAARIAAESGISAETQTRLRRIVEEYSERADATLSQDHYTAPEYTALVGMDAAFHTTLFENVGEGYLTRILKSTNVIALSFIPHKHTHPLARLDTDRSIREHSQLVDAIVERNPSRAEESARMHIQTAIRALQEHLDRRAEHERRT